MPIFSPPDIDIDARGDAIYDNITVAPKFCCLDIEATDSVCGGVHA